MLTVLFVALAASVTAQYQPPRKAISGGHLNHQVVAERLSAQLGQSVVLQLVTSQSTSIGTYEQLATVIDGHPVHGWNVKFTTYDNGRRVAVIPTAPFIAPPTWSTNANNASRAMVVSDSTLASEVRWIWYEQSFQLGHWEMRKTEQGTSEWLWLGDELIHTRDLSTHHHRDSTVLASVFLPDPITSAEATYGGDLADNNDQNTAALDAQLTQDSIPIHFNDTEEAWELVGEYAKAVDLMAPFHEPPTNAFGNFNFDRSQPGFEYVMVHYHIHRYQQWLNRIGLTDVARYPVPYDAHAGLNDQSSFVPGLDGQGELRFGVGGVDDAEDADVILHEYGHTISYHVAPGTNVGHERNSLDEGFGDYLALSYSRAITDYDRQTLYQWDGQNEFWEGRSLRFDVSYPRGLLNDIYLDGLIWTSALANIEDLIGREATQNTLIHSMYGYYESMLMTDAARLMLQADSLLYAAAHSSDMQVIFCGYGILEGCQDTVLSDRPLTGPYLVNGATIPASGGELTLLMNGSRPQHCAVYATDGKLIEHRELDGSQQFFLTYRTGRLARGMYILVVTTNDGNYSFKFFAG